MHPAAYRLLNEDAAARRRRMWSLLGVRPSFAQKKKKKMFFSD
jgi:hypothetical protein